MEEADVLDYLGQLPADSVDLVFGSPPYPRARTYGIGFRLEGEAWVRWMFDVVLACRRVSTGLVVLVIDSPTRGHRWGAEPMLLAADLVRSGVCLRKPAIYCRRGVPGGGCRDGLKNLWELCLVVSRGGPLPWADNTAMGRPARNHFGGRFGPGRRANGQLKPRRVARGYRANGQPHYTEAYFPPPRANPGNVIYCDVGGHRMGSLLAHENEASMPEYLAEFWVRTYCRPAGIVCDPFVGSGTTPAVALKTGRNFIGCDIRPCQVALTRRRIAEALHQE